MLRLGLEPGEVAEVSASTRIRFKCKRLNLEKLLCYTLVPGVVVKVYVSTWRSC